MGAPAEVLEEIFTVIEGGQDLGEAAKIIQFPSDNGQNVYNAVQVTQKGTNGTGMNYWVVAFTTGIGVAARAVSAGAIMLTSSVPAFAAALAPAMGLTVGYISYNLAPAFWDNLAKQLSDAGETVGGKVVSFMNENGVMTYSPGAVEILKNALLEEGVFQVAEMPEHETTGDYTVTENMSLSDTMSYVFGKLGYSVAITNEANAKLATLKLNYNDYFSFWSMNANESAHPAGWFPVCTLSPATETITLDSVPTGSLSVSFRASYDATTFVYTISDVSWSSGYYVRTFLGENVGNTVNVSSVNAKYGGQGLQNNARVPSSVPIEITYPDWHKWIFPTIDPGGQEQQIPDRFPIEYPNILPSNETKNYQNEAQDPEIDKEENPETVIETIQAPHLKPIAGYIPELPDPITDPDPEPDEDEKIDIEEEKPTPPEPVPPDPEIDPSPVIVTPPLPDTVDSSKLFTVYNPTSSQLDSLGGYLWDNDLIDILKKIWQNPLDGIISLSQVYATPVTGGSHNIILGYLDSGVSAAVVSQQFVTVDCGSVTIPELNENCLDYVPYTQMELYLPFVGIVEINGNEFMSGTISVKYKVDVYTGTCLAEVKCTRSRDLANGAILYTFPGNCSQQLPLTSGDAKGLFSSLLAGVGMLAGVASGGATGAIGGLSAMMSREMLHIGHSGSLSANAGIMGQKKPYLIISRERPYNANNYNKYYGYPANKTIFPGNYTGYVRIKAGRLQTKATEAEKDEIMSLLKRGVIV